MASKDWPRAIRQSQYENRTEALSSISHAIFSTWHSDNQSLLTEAERGAQEFVQMHGVSKWNKSSKLHGDLISFLAICQWREVCILSITWQPALKRVGRGATAHVHQSQINPQTSFVFKRITPSTFGSDEVTVFRTLISEVLVLGHPVIRDHPNIVTLVGVCFDVATSSTGEDTVWPVLVYEKAECRDLGQFMDSDVGKDLSFEQRMMLCIDIGTALMVMHSCSIFHGDVKPENVLIFQEKSGRYVAKVSDFGFSSLVTTDDYITVPRTRPWNGPEWHHRGFTLDGVKKLDVYSFGMLCLWLMCKDILSRISGRLSHILKEWDGADLFTQHTEATPGRTFLEILKAEDQIPILVYELLTLMTGLDQERKSQLSKFFLLCLASEPQDRSSDFVQILQLLSPGRLAPPPLTGIEEGEVYLPPPFQVSKSFANLMEMDYRVRKHVFRCLKLQATSYQCKACHDSATFQIALCYKVGFGISSSEGQVRYWLRDERDLEDLERELEVVRNADLSYSDTIYKLKDGGFHLQMEHSGDYERAGLLEASGAEYSREMRDMERSLGRLHPVIRELKYVLAAIHSRKNEFERAEILLWEIKEQLEGDPDYGHEDTQTLRAITDLADVFRELAKYEAAEQMYIRVWSGYEKLLGPSHPNTLWSIHELALIYHYQGNNKRAQALCRQALEGEITVLGESHANTLDTLNTLGMILKSQGKYEEAMEVFQRGLRLTKSASGQESPQTMFVINDLAVLSRLQGKYKIAENLSQQAIEGCEKLFGKEHSSTLECTEQLALTFEEQGKSAEAEGLLRRVLAGRESFLGSIHPDVLETQEALAVALGAQGDHKKADEMIRHVIIKKTEVLGPEHVDTLTAMSNLAVMLTQQRKLKAAANLLTQTLRTREKFFEGDNPSTLKNINDLAFVSAAQGRYAQAVTLLKRALAGRQKVLGMHHPDTFTTCNDLAAALTHVGRSAEAETILREVLDHVAAASDADDIAEPDTATVLWNLADLLHRQKRFDEAYPLYERACREYEQSGRAEREGCEEQFRDMRKERDRRARGGIWRLNTVHALVGVGEVVWERVVRSGKGVFR